MQKHGGWLLAQQLENFGVTHAFGVPGESYLPVLDGLVDTDIRFVNARNEGGAAFMASAWGQLTGEPGICMVTRGPGATNASIGVHTAMQGSVPMILLIGQVDQDMQDREAFQEIDYRKFYGDITKWVVEIRETDRIPEILSRAWSVAMSGRKGPVVIALPADILFAETNAEPLEDVPKVIASAPSQNSMQDVFQLLENAEKPLVIYGGTSWKDVGQRALEDFASAHHIPVAAAFRYQDGFDNHHPCYIGDVGLGILLHVRRAVAEADLILAINIRFGENSTDGYQLFNLPKMKQKLIHTHIAAEELNKIYQADLAIQCNPNSFSEALSAHSGASNWREWQSSLRREYEIAGTPPHQDAKVDMGHVMAYLQSHLNEDAILTNGAGNFAIWPSKYFRYGERQRLIAPQSGAMGYGLPAAIACQMADPERQVICFAGDGDFQMNMQELGTAMQMGLKPIVLILNNSAYGTIRMHQEREYRGRVSGTALANPDFTQIARAYGLHAEKVERTSDFASAFERAKKSPRGSVIFLIIFVEYITPTKQI